MPLLCAPQFFVNSGAKPPGIIASPFACIRLVPGQENRWQPRDSRRPVGVSGSEGGV